LPHSLFRIPIILAVDDKRANLLALEALLGDAYKVLFANSGREAVAIVRARADIDLILMDVQMPDMDGFNTALEIKRLDSGREIPIIFVTAVYNEDPFVRKGYEVGGIDYFSKPFDPEILKMKVGIYAAFRTREKVLQERERQMRASEELLLVGHKLSSALEDLRVGVLIADTEGRICQSTQEVGRILKSSELIESGCFGQLLGWWDEAGRMIKGQAGPLASALREGKSSHSELLELRCVDGSAATVIASAYPLHGLDRKLVGAVVLLRDLTESRQIGIALEERVTRLIGADPELEGSALGVPPTSPGRPAAAR
jgi:CheY-like chemotaxis protein